MLGVPVGVVVLLMRRRLVVGVDPLLANEEEALLLFALLHVGVARRFLGGASTYCHQ